MACEVGLNNFVVNTWPDDCIDELMFPVKWQLKIAKQRAKIILMEELQSLLKPNYRLDILSLKLWADDLISIFTDTIETNFNNPNENPIQQNN